MLLLWVLAHGSLRLSMQAANRSKDGVGTRVGLRYREQPSLTARFQVVTSHICLHLILIDSIFFPSTISPRERSVIQSFNLPAWRTDSSCIT